MNDQELIQRMFAVICDMMKSTGGALIVQDYGELNEVLIAARKRVIENNQPTNHEQEPTTA